ncbi:MAG: J domain-containing protein [Pleurocapsa sp. MO_226.B13]|nr:J domain-containing protein [Pleurocapsa sp. MO_226.B13]
MVNPKSDFRNRQKSQTLSAETRLANSYYGLMGLHPSASTIAIRRTYRQLSKKYHPDTTKLPPNVAVAKFQRLNEAYAVLSSPEKRSLYDLKIGYSRLNVIQEPNWSNSNSNRDSHSRTAYLDPTDRPLSSGEIFMLVLLAITFIGCLGLVMTVAYFRG